MSFRPFNSVPLKHPSVLLLLFFVFASVHLQAQDVSEIEKGTVVVERNGDEIHIDASDGSIIRYSSFNVNAGETVQFHQPGKQARVLNRIRSGNPSQINGNLFANGQVFLTNPAGIVFGSGATVDVGRLFAAAGRISNEDFRNGINQFTDLSGTVKNHGNIRGSEVHLLGDRVANFGNVVAEKGVVTMTSGEDVLIGSIDDRTFARVTNAGEPSGTSGPAVENSGTVRAEEGNVQVGAGDVYSLAIESTGELYAEEIEVDGGTKGQVQLSGTISAAETDPGETGGTIDVLGDELVLEDLTLDASGPAGGGRIRVGGDRHGEGTLKTATNTLIDGDTTLLADARDAGNGGEIVVWSDQTTLMYGSASARGGPEAGDGGFVEVSGTQLDTSLDVADVSAPEGEDGQVLFDPVEIVIRGGTDEGDDSDEDSSNFSSTDGDQTLTASEGPDTFEIFESEIEGSSSGNLVLMAQETIRIDDVSSFGDDSESGIPDLLLQPDVNLTLRTEGGNTNGVAIDLTQGGTFTDFELVTQDTGTIEIQGSTLGNSRGDVLVPRLESDHKISLFTGNGEIQLFGNINENSVGGSIVHLGSTEIGGEEREGGTVKLMPPSLAIDTGVGFSEFARPIDSSDTPVDLDVFAGASIEFQGDIGTSSPLNSLDVFQDSSGSQASLSGISVQTVGEQFYEVPVELEGDTVLQTTGGGFIGLRGRLYSDQTNGGPHSLTVDTQDEVVSQEHEVGFPRFVGVAPSGVEKPLSSLTVRSDDAITFLPFSLTDEGITNTGPTDIRTVNNQDYDGGVTLLRPPSGSGVDSVQHTFHSSSGSVRFRGPIDAIDDSTGETIESNGTSGAGLAVETPSGDTQFDGGIGQQILTNSDPDGLKFLTTDDEFAGGKLITGGDITTVGEVQLAGRDIFLNGKIRAGKGITLATENKFVNNVGKDVFDVSSGDRWLVYSIDPEKNSPGGLLNLADFEEFGVSFPNDPIGSGNGFYYEVTDQENTTNITTDITSAIVNEDQDTRTEITTQEQEDQEAQTTQTAEETQTLVETDTLVDNYSEGEISESISEVNEPSGELTSVVDEPTQNAANDPSYDQKIQDDATKSYDDSQGEVKQAEEQVDNLEAQAEELENQGDTEQAEEKREQAEEAEQELEQAQQQLNQAQQQANASALVNEQLRQRVQQESTQVQESLENLDMDAYQNQNQVDVTNVEAEGASEQPSNISAQQMRDKLVDELQTKIEDQPGPAHPAQAGTVNKLAAKDPIKGVGGSHIRSVSMSGTKAVPEENEEVKSYYDKLTEDVKDWDEENTLRFQIMGGGGEGDWGFGLINIFLNRETGVYLMRSNLDIMEGAASKIQGTDFGDTVQQEQVESFEGDSTSLTVSGELQ